LIKNKEDKHMRLSRCTKQRVRKKQSILVLLALVISAILYACGTGTQENGVSLTNDLGSTTDSSTGALYITDDLNADYNQVIAAIYSVEVVDSLDGNRLVVFSDEIGDTYDLRNLDGVLARLPGASIPVGTYDKIIITVSKELILVDNNDEQLIPNPEFADNSFTYCLNDKCIIEISELFTIVEGKKAIVDFDLKKFIYDADTNLVTAKVEIDTDGSKYQDYAEMKEDDYALKGIIVEVGTDSFTLILKRARFMPKGNVVTVLVDFQTQYACDKDDNVEVCQITSFDDLKNGMKAEIYGSWDGVTFLAEKVEVDTDNDLIRGEKDKPDNDDPKDDDPDDNDDPEPTNECEENPCKNGGTCIDGINSYTCECPAGYTGTNCETPINTDECAENPCKNGGTCIDGINSYTCECPTGYIGTNCETPINTDECAENPCQNGGTCIDGINSYTCECPTGYTGTNCEININECSTNPCQNGGTCIDGINSYTCECPTGYTGTNCEAPVTTHAFGWDNPNVDHKKDPVSLNATNMCSSCHGSELRGSDPSQSSPGFDPSCYTCHGKKWN
jgi:hypothetical protein